MYCLYPVSAQGNTPSTLHRIHQILPLRLNADSPPVIQGDDPIHSFSDNFFNKKAELLSRVQLLQT
ncbi:MAG: hypothetical protein D3906_04515 [Candidatus Electrothrix sp. AUS1_2]|nr:hypothetical protein [Candidatus Electrothrix sp. AUS1_2]